MCEGRAARRRQCGQTRADGTAGDEVEKRSRRAQCKREGTGTHPEDVVGGDADGLVKRALLLGRETVGLGGLGLGLLLLGRGRVLDDRGVVDGRVGGRGRWLVRGGEGGADLGRGGGIGLGLVGHGG